MSDPMVSMCTYLDWIPSLATSLVVKNFELLVVYCFSTNSKLIKSEDNKFSEYTSRILATSFAVINHDGNKTSYDPNSTRMKWR